MNDSGGQRSGEAKRIPHGDHQFAGTHGIGIACHDGFQILGRETEQRQVSPR